MGRAGAGGTGGGCGGGLGGAGAGRGGAGRGGGGGGGGMGLLTTGYRTFFRSNIAYLTLICTGAFLGERAVHFGGNALWEANNKGKLYKDLEGTVIGGDSGEDDE